MPAKKKKVLPAVKPVARPTRLQKRTRVAKKLAAPIKPVRKVFSDKGLFGALPGMSVWALPLLKELRDE
ncbi:MAG TPA: hypothetical protein VKG92_01790 [Flavobacteriales bacterium]|nr:hypothetical protein [Flavobacteriales bacterium]